MGEGVLSSPLVLITALSLVVALAAMAYALSCWQQRNMKYFAYLSIVVAINVFGYYLEVTATSLDAAVVASKVAYIGVPFTGLFLFLFSLDYADRTRINGVLRAVLFTLGGSFTVSVLLYPWVALFYSDVFFSTKGLVPHLLVRPGPLYYPCLIYTSVFMLLALVNFMLEFFRNKRYKGSLLFFIAVCIPLFVQLYTMVFGLIDGWNPQGTALALALALLAVYLARYKQAEWQSVERELVVQYMEDAFILLNSRGLIIDYNLSAEEYFPLLKKNGSRVKLEELWEFPAENYRKHGVHKTNIVREGKTLNLKVIISPLEVSGVMTGTLVIINDDTSNNQMLRELSRRARFDELTGLNNRATFFREANLSFALALRESSAKGCVLMIDIDHFKKVNDTYGHATGDEVLRYIGTLIMNRFRCTDIKGRYGGEELSVWMPATTLTEAYNVAQEIKGAVETKVFKHEGIKFSVTVSIGVASMSLSGSENFEDLVKKADTVLYEAKRSGRNRVCVYKQELTK